MHLQADVAILDEIDSGLDIDALREVASAVNGLKQENTATIMVTHYKASRLHSGESGSRASWNEVFCHLGTCNSASEILWPP